MSIENGMSKFPHSRGVLCVLKPHTAPTRTNTSPALRQACLGHQ